MGTKNTLRTVFLLLLAAFSSGNILKPSAAKAEAELITPVYADYNTFLGVVNILELSAGGTIAVNATVSVYNVTGSRIVSRAVTLQPGEQVDLIINDLIANVRDTYGVVEIQFNSQFGAVLEGRMSYYRSDPDNDQNFSFVFSRPIIQGTTGASHVLSNTSDAVGQGRFVPNWLQLINLTSTAKTFTLNVYNGGGVLLRSGTITLGRFQRRDFSAGHLFGEGVFLNEIIPQDASTRYSAAVTRYAANTRPGLGPTDFLFAVSNGSRAGAASDQFMLTTNQNQECFRQINWIELANVTAGPVTATLTFFNDQGGVIDTSAVALNPRAQFHFNASAVLPRNQQGSVRVASTVASGLLAQSTVYYLQCRANIITSAFVVPGVVPIAPNKLPLNGSFNRFLNQANRLILINATGSSRSVDLTVSSGGQQLFQDRSTVRPFSRTEFNLNDDSFTTQVDTFGTVSVDSTQSASLVAYVVRQRPDGTGIDAVNPTVLR